MSTVSIHMPEQSGSTGQILFLRKTSDGTLLNAGGDALTESPASSGRFTANVAESIDEIMSVSVKDSSNLVIRDGWIEASGTLVKDSYPNNISSSFINTIADAILSRNVSNVESSIDEHTLGTIILSLLEWSISGSTLTIKRTDGSTVHYTKTLSSASSGDQVITGVD